MPEKCPLRSGERGDVSIPMVCITQCGSLWGIAIEQDMADGGYDVYEPNLEDDESEEGSCLHPSLEGSSDGLHKLDGALRSYAIVDECETCGYEYGEQGYLFSCPYDT